MTREPAEQEVPEASRRAAHQVRLPGFILDEDVGLGDLIARTTSHFGVRPCGGCERRAAVLNQWLVFSSRRRT
jgi:hypothetical protein